MGKQRNQQHKQPKAYYSQGQIIGERENRGNQIVR